MHFAKLGRTGTIVGLLLLVPQASQAHRPRLVESNEPVEVDQPEISRAYYGTLRGSEHVFHLTWSSRDQFYFGLTMPDVPGAHTDVSARLIDEKAPGTPIATLDGDRVRWTKFFEPYGRQRYLRGPEFKAPLPAGRYEIHVTTKASEARPYVLAVGERESFPPGEIVKDFAILPRIASQYFHEPALSALFTPMLGVPLLLALAAAVGLILGGRWLWRRRSVAW